LDRSGIARLCHSAASVQLALGRLLESRLPLYADPEPLPLGDVVFLKGAFNRLFAVPRSDREGQALRLALQQVDVPRGWMTSRCFFMATG